MLTPRYLVGLLLLPCLLAFQIPLPLKRHTAHASPKPSIAPRHHSHIAPFFSLLASPRQASPALDALCNAMMRGGDGTEERGIKPHIGRGGAGERIGGAPARGRVRVSGVAGRRGGGRSCGGVASGPSRPKWGSNAVEETIVSDCVRAA